MGKINACVIQARNDVEAGTGANGLPHGWRYLRCQLTGQWAGAPPWNARAKLTPWLPSRGEVRDVLRDRSFQRAMADRMARAAGRGGGR